MASWPDLAAIKSVYTKLDASELDAKITWALGKSRIEIRSIASARYDTSLWGDASSVVPPDLTQVCYDMTYAWANLATHMGPKLSASDVLAQDLLKKARETVQSYASGSMVLLGDNGQPVGEISLQNGVALLDRPVFGMRPPLTWGVRLSGYPYNRIC